MACIVEAGKMPKKGIQSIQKMEVHTHEYVSMLIIFGDHYILLLNPTIGIKVGRQWEQPMPQNTKRDLSKDMGYS